MKGPVLFPYAVIHYQHLGGFRKQINFLTIPELRSLKSVSLGKIRCKRTMLPPGALGKDPFLEPLPASSDSSSPWPVAASLNGHIAFSSFKSSVPLSLSYKDIFL